MNASLRVVSMLSLLLAVCGQSLAQSYPARPIRMILGFVPGSITDVGGRVVANEMSKRLGQPMIVENRPGANGSIGANVVIKSTPDGYTINFGSVMNFHPLFVKAGAIDAGKELSPVSNSMSGTYGLFTSAKSPVNSLQGLLAVSKANPPGKLNHVSTSSGTTMLAEMLKASTGLTFTTIPYTGNTTQTLIALINGQGDFSFNSMVSIRSHLQSGSVRGIFYGGPKRHPLMPEVPTARELGLPKFDDSAFNFGVWAPTGMPRDILEKLSATAAGVVNAPEVSEQIQKIGFIPVGSSADEQLRTFNAEVSFWAEATRLAKFQPE